MMTQSLTITIPALNEQENIAAAIDSVLYAVKGVVKDYEVLVVDDGSRDQTSVIVQKKALENSRIKLIRHPHNQGYGVAFKTAIQHSTKEYLTLFPGDNDFSKESLKELIRQIGKADVITTYPSHPAARSFFRQIVSKSFVQLLNILFGLKLRYYNGPFIHRVDLLSKIQIRSSGLAVLAECLIKLLKLGYSCHVIPFEHTGRKAERSKAFHLKNVISVVQTLWMLVCDVYFSPPSRKSVQLPS